MKKSINSMLLIFTGFELLLFWACEFNPILFTGEVTDIDGNTYKTVIIGKQKWMSENLKVKTLNNAEAIPHITDSAEWSNLTTFAYCCYDNDSVNNYDKYGALYNWEAVNSGKLCPEGWHVPSDDEWKSLEKHLGLNDTELDFEGEYRGAGKDSKIRNESGWTFENGSNSSGFSALPGGLRGNNGLYFNNSSMAVWWTSTEKDSASAYGRAIFYTSDGILREPASKNNGHSIRCLKD